MDGPKRYMVDRVGWYEGMLLAPQHFQQLGERLDALVAWQTLATTPFGWGVRHLVLDTGLLAAGCVRVLALDAILPDGTAVCHDSTNPLHGPLEITLDAQALASAEDAQGRTIDIYLTLPVAAAMPHQGGMHRFRSIAGPTVHDRVSDAPPVEIVWQLPDLALIAGPRPPATHVGLRLCSVCCDNTVFRRAPVLPPLLNVASGSALWSRVAALTARVRASAAGVAKQLEQRAIADIDVQRGPRGQEDRLLQFELRDQLRCLLHDLPRVEAVLRTPGLHPLPLYHALAGMLGSMSMLNGNGLPPVPMDYDHANPSSVFTPLLDTLDAMANRINPAYRERRFTLRDGVFELALPVGTQVASFCIGVRILPRGPDGTEAAWMRGAVMGSASVYPSLVGRRVLGASRRQIDRDDALGVQAERGYLLFRIEGGDGTIVAGETLTIGHPQAGPSMHRPQQITLLERDDARDDPAYDRGHDPAHEPAHEPTEDEKRAESGNARYVERAEPG